MLVRYLHSPPVLRPTINTAKGVSRVSRASPWGIQFPPMLISLDTDEKNNARGKHSSNTGTSTQLRTVQTEIHTDIVPTSELDRLDSAMGYI